MARAQEGRREPGEQGDEMSEGFEAGTARSGLKGHVEVMAEGGT